MSATPVAPMASTQEADVLRRLMTRRRSCRAFRTDPVPHELIEQIVGIAGQSPSWCNTQPWQVVITEGSATDSFRGALTQHLDGSPTPEPDFAFPQRYPDAYDERRKAAGWQLYDSVGITRGDRAASGRQAARNFALFDAPHLAIVTTEKELGTYGVLDCGFYVSAFLLAAESVGVGAIAQASLASYPRLVREHFMLPPSRLVICGISFGWPDDTHRANGFRTPRAPIHELVTWATSRDATS